MFRPTTASVVRQAEEREGARWGVRFAHGGGTGGGLFPPSDKEGGEGGIGRQSQMLHKSALPAKMGDGRLLGRWDEWMLFFSPSFLLLGELSKGGHA